MGWTRRIFLTQGTLAGISAAAFSESCAWEALSELQPGPQPLRIGLVTYNLGKDWDLTTLLKNCEASRYDAVELRAGHAHGVELSLSSTQRAEVRKRFADSPVKLAQLGSTYEFHSLDRNEVRKNLEGCKEYLQLAHDVGSQAVKVRPNGLQTKTGVPAEKTLDQIGRALAELGVTADAQGVEIRVEVHGTGTSRVEYIQRIMEVANHPKVGVNWNSNQTDLDGGSLEDNFARVSKKIRHVHLRDLFLEEYPWRSLFKLLSGISFQGYCCAEIPESPDPLRIMRYFRALFLAYQLP